MEEKITGILIDVNTETVQIVTIDRTLDEYYRILDCNCIDIAKRKIGYFGDRIYDIICDDEGTFKVNPKISAIDDMSQPMLVGNLFIVKFDGKENETSLDQTDIDHIMRFIQKQATRKYPRAYPMLHQCEYA